MNSNVDQLRACEKALRGRSALSEAEELRDSVVNPSTADAEACWAVMWNKPLYANTYVANGDRNAHALAPYMPGKWRVLGVDPAVFQIDHTGGNNATGNFIISGSLATTLRDDHKIALHRLFAIQGAAKLLRDLVEGNCESAPWKSLANQPLAQLVPKLRQDLGRGWGPITVLHMLTDLGLAVKPDLHLVRTVHRLGLLADLPETKVPNEGQAIRINAAVADLARVYGGGTVTPSALRYMDKLLMEISRQGLLQPKVTI